MHFFNKYPILTAISVGLIFAICTNLYPLAYHAGASIALVMWARFSLSTLLSSLADKQKFLQPQLSSENTKQLVLVGTLLTVQSTSIVAALKFAPVSLVITTFYTFPIFTFLINNLTHKHKITLKLIALLILALIGVWLLVKDSSDTATSLLGVLLALVASLFQSLLNIQSQKLTWIPIMQISKYTAFIPAVIYTGVLVFTWEIFQLPALSWSVLAGFLFVAGLLLYFKSIALIGPVRTANLMYFEPVFAVTISTFLFHESLKLIQWSGIGIIVVASLLLELHNFKKENYV